MSNSNPSPFTFYDIVKNCDCYPYPNELVDDSNNKKYKNVVSLILENTNIKLGLILPLIIPALKEYNDNQNPKPFSIKYDDDAASSNYVQFQPHLNTFEKRTEAVRKLFEQWRQEKKFKRLEGWRNELYPVYGDNGEVAFLIERSASPLFGVVTYGIHLSAYLRTKDVNNNNKIKMWIAKRSSTKQTWPGMLDNTVAGGLSYKMSLQECVIKEAIEEASLQRNIAEKAKPVGAISYFISHDDGLQPEIQYVYDLELPEDVIPKPLDGEVDSFYLWDTDEVIKRIKAGEFKPNCALVIIDFLIRHSIIIPDNEPNYLDILTRMHRKLEFPIDYKV